MQPRDFIRSLTGLTTKAAEAKTVVVDALRQMRDGLAACAADERKAAESPLPLADVEARTIAAIARDGSYGMREYGPTLVYGQHAAGRWTTSEVQMPWSLRESPPWWLLCAAVPDLALAIAMAPYRQMPYEAGLPASDRQAFLDQTRAKRAELEAAEEQFIDEAAEAGFVIEHRPDVVARRREEARQQQLQAEREQRHQTHQAAVDAAHALRNPRFGDSEYLKSGGRLHR